MSKGEIIQHLGKGEYRIRQKLAAGRIEQEIHGLNARISELADQIPEAKAKKMQAEGEVDRVKSNIDEWVALYQQNPEGAREGLVDNQKALIRYVAELKKINLYLSELIAENLSALKRRSLLESVPDGRDMDVWCADYSEGLSGEVGLIDINDEGGKGAVIQPGFSSEFPYDAGRDGALFPNLAQTPAQVYFNAAILPGVQKWMPRYRVGTVTAVNGDLCNLTMDDARSSAQGLSINQEPTLRDIPVQYMDCGAAAFSAGDKALVRWFASGPQVVGFAHGPKPCVLPGLFFLPASQDGSSLTLYGQPITQENAPLGTASGPRPGWILHDNPGNIIKGRATTTGQANWQGLNGINLSWRGSGNRATAEGMNGSSVYFRLRTVLTLSSFGIYGESVIGAGYDGSRLLVASASPQPYEKNPVIRIRRVPVDEKLNATGDIQTVSEIDLESEIEINYRADYITLRSGCYWSADGSSAVITAVSVREALEYYYDEHEEQTVSERVYDYLQVWKISISGGGYTIERIYDADEALDLAIERNETTVHEDSETFDSQGRRLTSVKSTTSYYDLAERLIPIYVDYDKSAEVTAYWREPGLSRVSEDYRSESRDYDNDSLDSAYGGSRIERSSNTVTCHGMGAIVTDSGAVLAESGIVEFVEASGESTLTESIDNPDSSSYTRSGTHRSLTAKSFHGNSPYEYIRARSVVAIDARNRHAVMGHHYHSTDAEWAVSAPFANMVGGNEHVIADGPLSVSVVVPADRNGNVDNFLPTKLTYWQDGTQVESKAHHEPQSFDYSGPYLSYDGPSYNIGIFASTPISAPQCGDITPVEGEFFSARSGNVKGFSHRQYNLAEDDTYVVNQINGMGDPVPALFGKSSDDGYFLLGLTLV